MTLIRHLPNQAGGRVLCGVPGNLRASMARADPAWARSCYESPMMSGYCSAPNYLQVTAGLDQILSG